MAAGTGEHSESELSLKPKSFISKLCIQVTIKEILPWVVALIITAAELLVTLVNVRTGMLIHVILLVSLLVLASVLWYPGGGAASIDGAADGAANEAAVQGTPGYRFYLALCLAPIIRILSLAIPMWNLPPMYWYLVTGAPLLLTAYVVIRLAGYRSEEVGLRRGRLLEQAGVALTGLALGWLEFEILRPQSLLPGGNLGMLVLAGFILLVFTGLVEEVIFRGVMLKAADDYLGKTHSMFYSCFIFAMLHIIHYSFLDVVFVFGVAALFTFFVRRTGSLLGVTLAHGITNIMLYLVWPLVLLH